MPKPFCNRVGRTALALSVLNQFKELLRCQDRAAPSQRAGGRQGRSVPPPHRREGKLVSGAAGPAGATRCQNTRSDGGEGLDHWHLGYVLATTAFLWRQCSRYLTAPQSPLPADLCKPPPPPPPPPKYLLQLPNLGFLPPRHTYVLSIQPDVIPKYRKEVKDI